MVQDQQLLHALSPLHGHVLLLLHADSAISYYVRIILPTTILAASTILYTLQESFASFFWPRNLTT